MNKEIYAPFEIEHGFNNERALRNDESRASECEIKIRVNPTPAFPSTRLLSRSQWRKAQNRKVIVPDSLAKRVVVTSTGHHMHLFSIEDTVERKKTVSL